MPVAVYHGPRIRGDITGDLPGTIMWRWPWFELSLWPQLCMSTVGPHPTRQSCNSWRGRAIRPCRAFFLTDHHLALRGTLAQTSRPAFTTSFSNSGNAMLANCSSEVLQAGGPLKLCGYRAEGSHPYGEVLVLAGADFMPSTIAQHMQCVKAPTGHTTYIGTYITCSIHA